MPELGERRAVVIGAGRMGSAHFESISSLGQFREPHAVVDPSPVVRARFAANGANVYETLSDVDLETYTFAVVAAPTNQHLEISRKLANYPMKVLLEKPCGVDQSQHESLATLSMTSRCHFRVGFWRRMCEPFQVVKRLIGRGEIGAPRAVLACQWDAYVPPLAGQPVTMTGGIGLDCGIHETDTIAWLGLGRIDSLTAVVARPDSSLVAVGDHDQLVAVAVTDRGVATSISLSRTAGGLDEIFYKVIGDRGSVELRLSDKATVHVHGDAGVHAVATATTDYLAEALRRQVWAASSVTQRELCASVDDVAAAASPWFELRRGS